MLLSRHTRRREFITLLGGAAATWPLAAHAQQSERMRRIGVLVSGAESDPEESAGVAAFQRGLEALGWTEGRNLRVDYRWASADPQRMRAYAAELTALAPEVIVTSSNLVTTIVSQHTRTIPIVFATAGDVLTTGLIASMAHPGGNITGFTTYEVAIGGKLLELLKEVVPRLARIGVLYTQSGPAGNAVLHMIEGVAPSFGIKTVPIPARESVEIAQSIDEFARERDGGLVILSAPGTRVFRDEIIASAARNRLPAIYPYRYYMSTGGLMSYGADLLHQYRQTASYVDRILKGERPADLPVQAPTKYELIINLKTAKALGLTVPPALLAIADEVIE
jgi:putative ABC transport system substrate-binding protein